MPRAMRSVSANMKQKNHRVMLQFPAHDRWSRPSSDSRRWLPPVSPTAVDLVQALIVEKEIRLCSRLYRFHEFRPNRRLHLPSQVSSGSGEDDSGRRHVYANGAEEIKSHPFFYGIPWDTMHSLTPPFVPRFKENQSITKYFEDEKDICASESSPHGSSSLQQSGNCPPFPDLGQRQSNFAQAANGIDNRRSEYEVRHRLGRHWEQWRPGDLTPEKKQLNIEDWEDEELQRMKCEAGPYWEQWKRQRMLELEAARGIATDGGLEAEPNVAVNKSEPLSLTPDQIHEVKHWLGGINAPLKNAKQKKRARDKALRDPVVGRKVLELRKKGAFLGYTYRRIKPMGWEELDRYPYGFVGSGCGLDGAKQRNRARPKRASIIPVVAAT